MDWASWGIIAGEALQQTGTVVVSAWKTAGVSEFLAAGLGGWMTMLAQRLALKHDREKEDARRADVQKARAWAIFFKIHHVMEATTALHNHTKEARERADAMGGDLWQALQFPANDWERVTQDYGELLLLVEHRKLDIMQRYQESMVWISSLIQSVKMYRDMRVEFLSSSPSDMSGSQGTLTVNNENHQHLMPKIAHLKSLSESIEGVLRVRQPEMQLLITDYIAAMKSMVGQSPELELAPNGGPTGWGDG